MKEELATLNLKVREMELQLERMRTNARKAADALLNPEL